MSKKISKIVFLIMVIAFMFTFNTTSNAAAQKKVGDKTLYGIMGDVDGNKKINSSDGELILNYAAGAKKLSVLQKLRADINGDGKVNSIDALEITNYIQNLVTEKKLSSISIASNPTKTNYYAGDNLKTSGLKIKVVYSNNTSKEITSGFTCSPTKLDKAGTQKITVSYTENNITKTASFNVEVKKAIINVKSVTINSSTTNEVEVGKTIQLTATVKPDDATNKNVTWSSGKTNIATVDSTGKVKGIAEGTARIIATAADGSNVKDEIIITVKKPATPVYTGSLKVNDKLMLITEGWMVYKTETAAKNLDTSNTNGTLKKNDRIVVMEIKDNVIKIADNKYIYYGPTAANSFKPYFTVKFDAHGGTGSMSNQYIVYGVQTNLTANTFKNSGYTFNGWYAKRDDGTWLVKDKNGNTSWQTKAPEGGSYVKYTDKGSVAWTAPAGHTVTMYAQWKQVNEKYWWPIGSTTTTTVNGKLFATGTPVSTYISSGYGYRTLKGEYQFHAAIDITAANIANKYVIASKSGVVVISEYQSLWGHTIVIKHDDGKYTRYAHLNSRTVTKGESVQQGQVIGKVGSTGNSTGPHLDFRIFKNGNDTSFYINNAENPLNYVSATNARPR